MVLDFKKNIYVHLQICYFLVYFVDMYSSLQISKYEYCIKPCQHTRTYSLNGRRGMSFCFVF